MKTRMILAGAVLLLLLFAVVIPAGAQATDAEFQQVVTSYQQSSSSDAAERVIRLAVAMPQLPPIPEEARRRFVRGTVLFKDAKSPDDFKKVVDEFRQAVQLAPWWPEARYNFALALEAAGDYASAILNVRLYLLFKLPDADSRAAQDKIYALEARQEKAAKTKADEAAAQTVATPPQNSFDALLRKIDGRRYTHEVGVTNLGNRATKVYDVKDNTLVYGIILGGTYSSIQSYPHVRIQGLMSIEQIPPPPEELQGVVGKWPVERTLTISNDGDKITEHVRDNYGSVSEEIYFWQR